METVNPEFLENNIIQPLSPQGEKTALIYSLKNCFSIGDIGAFFGILGDAFSKIAVIIGVLLLNEQMPKDLVLGRILPGIAVGSMLGSFLYFREAYRLGVKEQRNDVTALPFGVGSTQVFTWLFIIIVPVHRQTGDPYLAWSVGLAACFIGSFVELAGTLVSGFIKRYIPKSALIANMAAAAVVWLSFNGTVNVFNKPHIAVLSLFIAFLTIFYRKNSIPFIPNAVLILAIGAVSSWLTKETGVQHIQYAVQNAGLYPPSLYLSDIRAGFGHISPYLSIIIPLQIGNFLTTIQAVESAELAQDSYPLQRALIIDGVTTLVSALFGSPFPTTVYYGHSGWKRSGARGGYVLFMAVPYTLLFFGLPLLITAIIPFEVIIVFLVALGFAVCMDVQNNFKADYSIAVTISLLPLIAQYIISLVDTILPIFNSSLQTIDIAALQASGVAITGLLYLSYGAFASSLLYSIWIIYVLQKNYLGSGITALVLAGLSSIGFIHQQTISLFPRDNLTFVLLYLSLAFFCFILYWKKKEFLEAPFT